MSREETQERATNVGPVKNKEKKREREREREREGRKDQKSGCVFGAVVSCQILHKAKCTVMGGQQVCNQACRPCNDGGVTVTTQ